MNSIGDRIKAARREKKISQKELAKRIGMSAQQLGQYENGLHVLSITKLLKIAEELQVPCGELLPEIQFRYAEFPEVCISEEAYALIVGLVGLYGYKMPLNAKGIVIKVC